MATVKEIKEELQFNRELTGLLEVMRDIAVFQFRTLQGKKERFVKFAQLLRGFFRMVNWQKTPHYFVNPRTDKLGIIMITSDEGFMGGLNLQVINSSLRKSGAGAARLIVVGERGQRYLKEISRESVAFSAKEGSAFGGKTAGDAEKYKLALELKDYIVKGVRNGEFGRVVIAYPKCISFMAQKVEITEILPIAPQASSLKPHVERAAWSMECGARDDIIIESPLEGIVEYLVEEMVLQKLLEILEESKLSEFAARAIHLEKSSQELTEEERSIKFQYFRAYHESIDKNTRELFSAQIIRRKT